MAVGDAHVFWLSHTSIKQLFFPKPSTTFLTCFCRGENLSERKFASTGDQTHKHQVMSPTCSPLSHPGGLTNEHYFNDDYERKQPVAWKEKL